jgi:hypothetical protein
MKMRRRGNTDGRYQKNLKLQRNDLAKRFNRKMRRKSKQYF